MSLTELLPEVESLSRGDKYRLLHLLIAELEQEEEAQPLKAGQTYPVWSPYDAHDAAATLLEVLQTGKDTVA